MALALRPAHDEITVYSRCAWPLAAAVCFGCGAAPWAARRTATGGCCCWRTWTPAWLLQRTTPLGQAAQAAARCERARRRLCRARRRRWWLRCRSLRWRWRRRRRPGPAAQRGSSSGCRGGGAMLALPGSRSAAACTSLLQQPARQPGKRRQPRLSPAVSVPPPRLPPLLPQVSAPGMEQVVPPPGCLRPEELPAPAQGADGSDAADQEAEVAGAAVARQQQNPQQQQQAQAAAAANAPPGLQAQATAVADGCCRLTIRQPCFWQRSCSRPSAPGAGRGCAAWRPRRPSRGPGAAGARAARGSSGRCGPCDRSAGRRGGCSAAAQDAAAAERAAAAEDRHQRAGSGGAAALLPDAVAGVQVLPQQAFLAPPRVQQQARRGVPARSR
jgi:hypothetical protein